MTTASYPPYSPDLALCDFFLFSGMKRDLKGKLFQNVEEVRGKTTEALKTVTLQEFQNCFEGWKRRWDKCIVSQEVYFEGDEILKMFREIYELKKIPFIFGSPPRVHKVKAFIQFSMFKLLSLKLQEFEKDTMSVLSFAFYLPNYRSLVKVAMDRLH